MITFKQLEALYWIAELGNFAAAADKLNTTQSAISKRVNELESVFDVVVFDRSRRSARLTEKGTELLLMAKDLLEMRNSVLERMSTPEVLQRRLRIGVTELTALTWLPKFIEMIKQQYPRVTLEPQVEHSSVLFERLSDDSLDIVIAPDIQEDSRFTIHSLKSVTNAWMSKPGYIPNEGHITLQELSKYSVLTQGARSGTGLVYERWLSYHNVTLQKTLFSNSLVAQIGLTLSGLGVSYLPVEAMAPLINKGELEVVSVSPELPKVRYSVIHRADRDTAFYEDIVNLSQKSCDFRTMLMGS